MPYSNLSVRVCPGMSVFVRDKSLHHGNNQLRDSKNTIAKELPMNETTTTPWGAYAGAVIGLLLGLVWVRYGFPKMMLIAGMSLVGMFVGAIVRSELHLREFLIRLLQRNQGY